jgi:hypothetical protein
LENNSGAISVHYGLGISQGRISGSPGDNGLPNQYDKADKRPENSPDSCFQIATVEYVERIFLSLLFLSLPLRLLYRATGRALDAGCHRSALNVALLGVFRRLLTLGFADSASAFGCSG